MDSGVREEGQFTARCRDNKPVYPDGTTPCTKEIQPLVGVRWIGLDFRPDAGGSVHINRRAARRAAGRVDELCGGDMGIAVLETC